LHRLIAPALPGAFRHSITSSADACNGKAESLRGSHIDHQLKLGRPLQRVFSGGGFSNTLPLPAPAEQADQAEACGEERESGWHGRRGRDRLRQEDPRINWRKRPGLRAIAKLSVFDHPA
jgi:hypothetical protein